MKKYLELLKTTLKEIVCHEKLSVYRWSFEDIIDMIAIAYYHELHLVVLDAIEDSKFEQSVQAYFKWLKLYMMKDVLKHKVQKKGFASLIEAMNESKVPYRLLKGNTIEMYYKNRDTRFVSDYDILIGFEDQTVVDEKLTNIGYRQVHKDGQEEAVYYKSGELPIELHFTAFKTDIFDKEQRIDQYLFMDKRIINDSGKKYPVPGNEAHLAYMLGHLAKHLWGDVILLRQLMDISLFINNTTIDWVALKVMLESMGIYEVGIHILALCYEVFGVDVGETKHCDLLRVKQLEDYIIGSIESKFNQGEIYLKSYRRYLESTYSRNRFMMLIKIVFPMPKYLSSEFAYAKKVGVLLPVAWLHRLFVRVVFNRKRVKGLVKATNKKTQINNQIELLNYFKLHRS